MSNICVSMKNIEKSDSSIYRLIDGIFNSVNELIFTIFLVAELQNLRGSQDEVLQKVQQQNGNDHVRPCRA